VLSAWFVPSVENAQVMVQAALLLDDLTGIRALYVAAVLETQDVQIVVAAEIVLERTNKW